MEKELLDKYLTLPIYNRYAEFLDDRRESSAEYTKQIMKILLDARKDQKRKGWVRARDFKNLKLCSDATLFRLLKDLTETKIITQKKRETHNLSSYCLPDGFLDFHLLTREEIMADHHKLSEENSERGITINIAHTFIAENGLLSKYMEEYPKKRENYLKLPDD